MRRLRFEDDIARSEASIETFRVLVSIERRIYVHPLKDHWEICFDRLSRSLAESCTIGTMRSHRSPVFTRSMGRSIVHYSRKPDDLVQYLDRKTEDKRPTLGKLEDVRAITSRGKDSVFMIVRWQVSRVSCRWETSGWFLRKPYDGTAASGALPRWEPVPECSVPRRAALCVLNWRKLFWSRERDTGRVRITAEPTSGGNSHKEEARLFGKGYAARALRYTRDKAMTENSCADSAILQQLVQRAGY